MNSEWVLRLEKHYFTSAGASPMGPPHQPVLFLAAAVEKGSLWGGRMVGWGVFLGLCTRGGSHLKRRRRRREADGRKKLEGVRKEGCGQKKTGGWCLLLCSCGMKMTPSSRGKLSVCRWLISSCGFEESRWNLWKYGSVSVSVPVRPTWTDVLPESPQALLRNPELLLILNVIWGDVWYFWMHLIPA